MPEATAPAATEVTTAPQVAEAAAPATEAAKPAAPSEADKAKAQAKEIERIAIQRATIARREAELKKQAQDYEARAKELEAAKNDPLGFVARQLGVESKEAAYQRITNQLLGEKEAPDPMKAAQSVEAKLAALEAKLAEKEEAQKQASLQAQIGAHKRHLSDWVNKAEGYKLIKALNMHEAIYETMLADYQKTGRQMSEKEAADAVETYLLEEAVKVAALDEVKAKLAPPPPAPSKTTISNKTASASSSRVPRKRQTEEERLAAAAAYIKMKP